MRKYIKEIIVLKNFFYLSLMKLSNLLLPLLTIPYLIRVLGFDNVGSINLASTMMMYLCIIVSYSYTYTGAKFVSENIDNVKKLSCYYTSSMVIRFWLLVLSLFLLFLVITFVPNYNDSAIVFYLSFGMVLSHYLMPVWVFQGYQTMKYITYIDLFSKLLFTSLIFIYVNDRDDFYLVPLYNSLGSCVAGLISLLIIRYKFKLKFISGLFFDYKRIVTGIKDGKDVFIQQIYVSLYGPVTILFLGALSTDIAVGYYTIAEKILNIPLMLILVAVQAYYPYAVKVYKENIVIYYQQLRIIIVSIFIIMTFLLVLISIFSVDIYFLITGTNDEDGLLVFNILILGLTFGALGQLLTQVFVTTNNMYILKKISFFIMLITLVLTPFIIVYFDVFGLAVYTVLRQFIVITMCLFFIVKFKREEFSRGLYV